MLTVLSVWLTLAHLRRHTEVKPWWFVVAALGGGVCWWQLRGFGHPTGLEHLHAVQEGSTGTHVQIATGGAAHAGYGFTRYLATFAGPAPRDLRDLIALHHLWGAGTTAILAALFAGMTRNPAVTALLTVVFVTSPLTIIAAGSAQPALEIAPVLALTILPIAALRDPTTTGRVRRVAWIWLLLGTAIIATLRVELAVIPGLALVLKLVGDGRIDRLRREVMSRGSRLMEVLKRPSVLTAISLGLVLTYPWVLVPPLPSSGHLQWVLSALHPYDPSLIAWPAVLWTSLPLGVVVLAALGWGSSARHPVATGGVALSSAFLLRLYFHAGHGSFIGRPDEASLFELQRYLMPLIPCALLFAAWGWRHLHHTGLKVAMLAAVIVPPWPNATTGSALVTSMGPTEALPLRDTQLEVRALVDVLDRFPRCRVVTHPGEPRDPHAWVVFTTTDWVREHLPSTPRSSWSIQSSGDPDQLVAAVDALGSPGGCVLFWRGLGCNLQAPSPCDAVSRQRAPLEELQAGHLPWIHPKHRLVPQHDHAKSQLFRLRD